MAFVHGIIDRIILVAGIIAVGCVPSFIAQYQQRVGGRLDQVLQDLAPFQAIANQLHHGSLQELIQHHLDSSDPTFYSEGAAVQAMVESAERLKQAFQALNTDLYHQMSYLVARIDMDIARATWEVFSPSFGLTVESVVFGSAVGVLIWLTFQLIWYVIARLIRVLTAH